jgi:hypothetical protein
VVPVLVNKTTESAKVLRKPWGSHLGGPRGKCLKKIYGHTMQKTGCVLGDWPRDFAQESSPADRHGTARHLLGQGYAFPSALMISTDVRL